jgi:hypothetical protein
MCCSNGYVPREWIIVIFLKMWEISHDTIDLIKIYNFYFEHFLMVRVLYETEEKYIFLYTELA